MKAPTEKTYWPRADKPMKKPLFRFDICDTCCSTVQINSEIRIKHDTILYRNRKGELKELNQCHDCISQGKELEYKQM